VVLDTNVIVSAVIRPGSNPDKVLGAFLDGRYEVIASPALLSELQKVLERPRIARRGPRSQEETTQLLSSVLVEPSLMLNVIAADPADDRVLEAAVAGEADYIVSGDRHLLDLNAYQGILIVSPAVFLAILAEE
jgi:putative PIN family toxin of toxin-antitoxin system